MLDVKKGLKIITFVFVLVMCFSVISIVDAATFSITGTPVQFGWEKDLPETGKTISSNTGAAIYYPATINGNRAFCMDYLKAVPSSGASLSQSGTLSTLQKAIILEGLERGSAENIMAATQLAFWKACVGNGKIKFLDYNQIKQHGQYPKPNVRTVSANYYSKMVTEAKDIYTTAKNKSSSDFSGSSNKSTLNIDDSQVSKQIRGEYAYVGPLIVNSSSNSKITAQILDNPGGIMLVGTVGAINSVTTVPSNGVVYLKVPLNHGSGNQRVTFSTSYTTKQVEGYIYSAGDNYQRFGMVTTEEENYESKKTAKFKWDLNANLRIIKKDESNSKPIAGAKFTLYNSSKKSLQTKVTDSNGIIEFTDLTYGTYYIKEISAPQGYIILESDFQEVDLTEGDVSITVKNRQIRGRIRITKYVEYDGLLGNKETVGAGDAQFEIYTSKGVRVDQMVTASNGVATSNYLSIGSYYLKETAVNTNYMIKNPKSIPFEITEGDNNQVIDLGEFINEGITGELEIYKYTEENGKKIPIQGAKFEIYSGTNSNNATLITTVTTNAGGRAYLDDLQDGRYLYREIYVPNGYKLDNSYKSFSVSKTNKLIKESVYNEILYGTLNIVKTDEENKKPLEGVVFDIYASNKTTKVATITTDKNGKANTKLKYGTYYVKEVKAPSKVIMNTKEHKIIIGEGENAKLEYTLDITNKLIDLGIKLYKVDNENKPISGVKFALYSDAEGKTQVGTATTNSLGLALFEKLKEGTYYYKELSAPDGYITTKISQMKPIKIDYNTQPIYEETIVNEPILGQVKIHKIDEENKVVVGAEFDIKDSNGKVVGHLVTDKDGNAISGKLRKGNYTLVETKVPFGYILKKDSTSFTINKNNEVVELTIVNEYNKGKAKIKKVDADTKKFIDGAVFEIYKVEADGSSKLVDTIRKYDSTGVGTSQELKNGKYYLIETVAPDGAILDNTKYEFEITDAAKVFEITIENKIKKGQIALIKNDDKGNPIEGVKFQILDSDKKTVIEELTTDATGKATSSRIKVGTYYVKETFTPELYVPLINLITVEIKNDNQVITLKDQIINKRITGGIKVIKKNDAGTPIAGVEFAVYKEGAALPTTTLVTNEQGVAMYTDLVLGKYYFVETKVPDNLYINSEKVSFEITEIGQLIEKTVVNERVKGKLVINKTNSENGTGIEGVTFEIYDANKNVLGSIYTDANGVATTENLKDKNGNVITLYAGTYYYAETAAPTRFYFETDQHSFTIAKGNETVTVNVQNIPFKIPQTGGVMGTDTMIITIVSIVSIAGYIFGNIMINRRRFA